MEPPEGDARISIAMEDCGYQKLINRVIREQLDKGKTITLRVLGGSMRPLIRRGDRVHIQGCDPRGLSAADIITYQNNGLYVTHRVVWIRRGADIRFITKGDRELTVDPPLSPHHIIGKVAAIGRANRTLHLEAPHWRLINHLLWMLSVVKRRSSSSIGLLWRNFPLRNLALQRETQHTSSAISRLNPQSTRPSSINSGPELVDASRRGPKH